MHLFFFSVWKFVMKSIQFKKEIFFTEFCEICAVLARLEQKCEFIRASSSRKNNAVDRQHALQQSQLHCTDDRL